MRHPHPDLTTGTASSNGPAAEPGSALPSPRALGARRALLAAGLLGILPTGTGKSLCYQIPALSRFEKTGALTVVISPLVALMADQVQGMERAGISSAVTINPFRFSHLL